MSVECEGCGARVSEDFARVFGAPEDDAVHACNECTTNRELYRGVAAGRPPRP